MRIRIVQKPVARSIDGIRLDRFEIGAQYDVGNRLGSLMLAEGWGEPVSVDDPAALPFRKARTVAPRKIHKPTDPPDLAADRGLKKRRS